MGKRDKKTEVYRLTITLEDSRPAIWRTVLVPSNYSLGQLHYIIQDAMGWTNSHLHQFVVNEVMYADQMFDLEHTEPESDVSLSAALPKPKSRIRYEYDFGDSWHHSIVLEDIFEPEDGAKYPTCVDGRNACPPEDCGGIYGYADFVESMTDPKHPEHEEMMEWYDGPFDPKVYDQDLAIERVETDYCRKETEKAMGSRF